MYLAYIDDSGRRKRDTAFHVLAAVLVHESLFISLEISAGISLSREIPPDKLDEFLKKFTEFHASDLYNGWGAFDSSIVDEKCRFGLIKHLLMIIKYHQIKVVYGGVNKTSLQRTPSASANVIDMCFRMCAEGIEFYIDSLPPKPPAYEFALLIADEFNKDKVILKDSFRQLRKPTRPPAFSLGRIWHVHDDMYFGDSKDSIGLQLADLCAYFIAKHLQGGGDAVAEGFYKLIEPHIVGGKVEPL